MLFKIKMPCISYCLRLFFMSRRSVHSKCDDIVIASAVRTPWGKIQGQLSSLNVLQLGQIAVETAVKQAAVPLEDIKQIIMTERPFLQKENCIIFSEFLKKSLYTAIKSEDEGTVTPLLKALDVLKSEPKTVVVIGCMESGSQHERLLGGHHLEVSKPKTVTFAGLSSENLNNYIAYSREKYEKARRELIFEAEIVPLNVQTQAGKRKVIQEVKQDETFCENPTKDHMARQYTDGASALVLTTWSKAQELNISPLGQIIDYECKKNSQNILETAHQCIEKLFARAQADINNIQHWEIDDCLPQLVMHLKQHLNLNKETVNPNGGCSSLEYSSTVFFPRQLTHMTHALKPKQYGCIVSITSQETMGLIVKKLPLPLSSAKRLPLVTLYTKDPCYLCDTLVDELESNFCGEYELEKVFIDTKENIRYLRLYRWDIPVVFLNNQFLCMHRLNHNLLRQKLDLLKEQ